MNQYECSMATPRSNSACTLGSQEVGKLSLPSFSSCWPKALQLSAAVMPAISIRHFRFMGTSGRARSTAAVDCLKRDFANEMAAQAVSPAVQAQEFGIVHSGMIHRHCTYVECFSLVMGRRPVNCPKKRNEPGREAR